MVYEARSILSMPSTQEVNLRRRRDAAKGQRTQLLVEPPRGMRCAVCSQSKSPSYGARRYHERTNPEPVKNGQSA